jgi:hypothetical protein
MVLILTGFFVQHPAGLSDGTNRLLGNTSGWWQAIWREG